MRGETQQVEKAVEGKDTAGQSCTPPDHALHVRTGLRLWGHPVFKSPALRVTGNKAEVQRSMWPSNPQTRSQSLAPLPLPKMDWTSVPKSRQAKTQQSWGGCSELARRGPGSPQYGLTSVSHTPSQGASLPHFIRGENRLRGETKVKAGPWQPPGEEKSLEPGGQPLGFGGQAGKSGAVAGL